MTDIAQRLTAALADRYRVERELGAGGMATVFLARDLKHDRDVAIKVIHPDLGAALGGERFLAEIRTTAKLQHPHILPLLDSGDAGDGVLYYVMPFVRGETLRARLERERQLPVDDALRIAREAADALQHAHAQGIVHRDVKPENILLQDGHALVADFGIALAVQTAGGARMTQTGLSLGTPQYMSPEQAMGERTVDARSDQYALAAVTYEMLVGEPPFTGPSVQAIVARLLSEEPRALGAQRRAIPEVVDAAVCRALEKIPADRFATIGAFAAALAGEGSGATMARRTAVRGAAPPPRVSRVTATALVLAVAGFATAAWSVTRSAPARGVLRYRLVADSVSAQRTWTGDVSISPDGSLIIRRGGPGDRLLARRRDAVEFTPIDGTEGALAVTFSPDGSRMAFYQEGKIVVMPVAGGPSTVIADSLDSWEQVSWGPDDYIYRPMSTSVSFVIGRCPVTDCRRLEPFTQADTLAGEVNHLHAEPMPDGSGLLFTIEFSDGTRRLAIQRRGEQTHRIITDGVRARYVDGRHLLYSTADSKLWVAPFDATAGTLTGTPRLVAENLPISNVGAVDFAVSRTGTLVYSEERSGDRRELVWVSRDGRQTPFSSSWRGAFTAPAISRDGRQVAVSVRDGARSNIWIHPTSGGAPTQLTADRNASEPAWSPDGRSVTFLAGGSRTNTGNLVRQPLDGGAAQLLVSSARPLSEQAWLPDGRGIIVRTTTGTSGAGDLLVTRDFNDTTAVPLLASPRSEWSPTVSPDGRWVAYAANTSGRVEVYVSPLADPASVRTIVSSGGGSAPRWSPDGRALYFLSNASQLLEARVTTSGAFRVESVRALFDARGLLQQALSRRSYDVAPDGRFLFIRRADDTPAGAMIVAEHWLPDLLAKDSP